MFKPTVEQILKPFAKMVSKLEDLTAAHEVEIDAADSRISQLLKTEEAKISAIRTRTNMKTLVLMDHKAESISEMIKAQNAVNMIKKLIGVVYGEVLEDDDDEV